MLKKLIFVSALSVFMLSAFTLTPEDSKAATLPQVLFSDNGKVFISVMDLGTILDSEWEIIVINDFPIGAVPSGVGFRNYNPTYGGGVHTIIRDDNWLGAAMAYIWTGDGTPGYLSLSNGVQAVRILTVAPPAPSSSLESTSERIRRK